jgi:hypothetical protein
MAKAFFVYRFSIVSPPKPCCHGHQEIVDRIRCGRNAWGVSYKTDDIHTINISPTIHVLQTERI